MKKIFSIFAAVLFAGSMFADPITCAEAAKKATDGSTDEVTVRGYVTEIVTPGWSSQYKNISFWMADTKDGGKVFEAFRAACATADDAPLVGALVEVTGTLTLYNTTPELAAGCTFVIKEQGTPEVEDADVVFLPSDFEGQGQAATQDTPGGAVSTTKNGVTVATNNGYGHNLALRVYKDAQFSITSEAQVIAKIQFQFYDTYTGGLETEITVGAKEWKVEAMEKQARVEKIKIYFENGAGVENVVLGEKAQKVMIDGNVYIVRDNKLFNLQGAQVR